MRTINRFIRQALRRYGIEVGRYHWPRLIATVNPDVVLDIGANIGQFADELWACGYRKRLVSFEPLTSAHALLVQRSARNPNWTIAPRMALGDVEGEARINVAGNSFSSSLMSMRDLHRQVAPSAAYVGQEVVPLRRLDSVIDEYVGARERFLIKIDVQGYEQKVLAGAPQSLRRVSALQFEASLAEMYEGETLFRSMVDQVAASGLELWSITPALTSPQTGRLLQVDCFFVRPESGITASPS